MYILLAYSKKKKTGESKKLFSLKDDFFIKKSIQEFEKLVGCDVPYRFDGFKVIISDNVKRKIDKIIEKRIQNKEIDTKIVKEYFYSLSYSKLLAAYYFIRFVGEIAYELLEEELKKINKEDLIYKLTIPKRKTFYIEILNDNSHPFWKVFGDNYKGKIKRINIKKPIRLKDNDFVNYLADLFSDSQIYMELKNDVLYKLKEKLIIWKNNKHKPTKIRDALKKNIDYYSLFKSKEVILK